MKTFKRFSAILIAVLMMVSMMVVPASAAGEYSITIKNASGHTFEAHQIFAGDLSGKVLSNIEWGSGVAEGADNEGKATAPTLLNALQNSAYFDTTFDTCTTATAVAEQLEVSSWDNLDTINFAKIVAQVVANRATKNSVGTGATDTTANTFKISGLNAGYYLVIDNTVADSMTTDDVYSRYIIQVAGQAEVEIKKALPDFEKRVSLSMTSGYADAVNTYIGDTVYFSLTAKMPANIAYYDAYYLQFEDEIPAFLSNAKPEKLYVNTIDVTGSLSDEAWRNTYGILDNTANNKLLYTIEKAKSLIESTTKKDIVSTDRITLVFSATVDSDATFGSAGNVNTAKIHYYDNPNGQTTTATQTDTAIVYTYQLKLNKVDGDDTSKSLTGVGFILHYLDLVDGSTVLYLKADKNSDGVYTITEITTDKSKATEFVTNADGQILLKGITPAEYHLEETKTVSGYNLLKDEQIVTITAPLDVSNGNLKSLSATTISHAHVTVNSAPTETGLIDITITNFTGSTLPSTGGIGTTIFYGIGGVLVIGALSLLIVRKRTTAK